MNYLIKTQFGSHCYGTNVETSDIDIKGVFLPTASQILNGKYKDSVRSGTKTDPTAKNQAGDIDEEFWSLKKFIGLLMEGNTPALDLLFTPEEFYIEKPSYWWNVIKENRHKLISAQADSFVGYCVAQAGKYGVKGSRVHSVRNVLQFLKEVDPNTFLGNHETQLKLVIQPLEHASIIDIPGAQGKLEPHLECCNRKIPFHSKVGYAIKCFQKIFDEYGHRALLAEKEEGLDRKALMHGVRVCNEAVELLTTGKITFPRPEKDLLLQIRKGELPYKEIESMIESGLERVKEAKIGSVLPPYPDYEFADKLVETIHEEIVLNARLEKNRNSF